MVAHACRSQLQVRYKYEDHGSGGLREKHETLFKNN
jgi:hypothetical protein